MNVTDSVYVFWCKFDLLDSIERLENEYTKSISSFLPSRVINIFVWVSSTLMSVFCVVIDSSHDKLLVCTLYSDLEIIFYPRTKKIT